MIRRLSPAVLLAAIVLQVAVIWGAGRTYIPSHMQDANVYVEAAHNLWHQHRIHSYLSRVYPPGYSVVIAPATARPGRAAMFRQIYLINMALAVLGAMALLPLLRDTVGKARSWLVLAVVVWLPSVWLHHLVPQSENLYAAIALAATGLLYVAVKRDSWWAWLGLGALLGLSFVTRRFGVVLILAALTTAVAMIVGLCGGGRPTVGQTIRRLAFVLGLLVAGMVLGFGPEWPYLLRTGHLVSSYRSGAGGHTLWLLSAFASPSHLLYVARTLLRQVTYLQLASAGACTVTAWYVARTRPWQARGEVDRGDLALAATVVMTLLATAGTVVLTASHMLGGYPEEPYDLYSRYLDPAVAPLLVVAVVICARLGRADLLAWRSLSRWMWPSAALALLALPIVSMRGPRLVYFAQLLQPWSPAFAACSVVLATVAFTLAAGLAAGHRRLAEPAALAAVVVALNLLGAPFVMEQRLDERMRTNQLPELLEDPALAGSPPVTLGVVADIDNLGARGGYRFWFKTDHPLEWVEPDEIDTFYRVHPDGVLLAHRRTEVGYPIVAREGGWRLHCRVPPGR